MKNISAKNELRQHGRYVDLINQPVIGALKVGVHSDSNIGADKKDTHVPSVHGSYAALILHPRWKSRRKEILERDYYQCVICGNNKELHVHHRQYHFIVSIKEFKAPWDYPDNLLLTLCTNCHARGHSKFKVPIIKI